MAAFALPADGLALTDLVGVGAQERGELFFEARSSFAEKHAVLWTLRAGDAGLDLAEIESDRLRVLGFGRVWSMEQ